MEIIILDSIPFTTDFEALANKLRLKEGSPYRNELRRLATEAEGIARPKAMVRLAAIDSKSEMGVIVEGISLTSRVLRVNLEQAQRIFPYIATCGTELDAWSKSYTDMLASFWADAIKEMALRVAIQFLYDYLDARFQIPTSSTMNPGSLEDWPIQEQRPLFDLLGDPQQAIGVMLNSSYLMQPTKSVSGVRFPLEETFASCQLCPRQNCPSRRAPYDPDLYEQKYHPPANNPA